MGKQQKETESVLKTKWTKFFVHFVFRTQKKEIRILKYLKHHESEL